MNDDHEVLLITITSCFVRNCGDQNVVMINKKRLYKQTLMVINSPN